MIFTPDERTLLLLYCENDKGQTLKNLADMQKDLQTDERELYELTTSVIVKLSAITEQAFQALDLFEEMG